jgi:hypothetical protein
MKRKKFLIQFSPDVTEDESVFDLLFPRIEVAKLFLKFSSTLTLLQKARVFAARQYFFPASLIFCEEGQSLAEWSTLRAWLLALHTSIKRAYKTCQGLKLYHLAAAALTKKKKSFVTLIPGLAGLFQLLLGSLLLEVLNIKITPSRILWQTKLERLSLENIFSLVLNLPVWIILLHCPNRKHFTKLKIFSRNKRSSLFLLRVNDEETFSPGTLRRSKEVHLSPLLSNFLLSLSLMLFHTKFFQSSPIFAIKALAYPSEVPTHPTLMIWDRVRNISFSL